MISDCSVKHHNCPSPAWEQALGLFLLGHFRCVSCCWMLQEVGLNCISQDPLWIGSQGKDGRDRKREGRPVYFLVFCLREVSPEWLHPATLVCHPLSSHSLSSSAAALLASDIPRGPWCLQFQAAWIPAPAHLYPFLLFNNFSSNCFL